MRRDGYSPGWAESLLPHGRKETALKIPGEPGGNEGADQNSQDFHPLPLDDGGCFQEIRRRRHMLGANHFSIIPAVRTKLVETPRYFPAGKTENQLTIPIRAPVT